MTPEQQKLEENVLVIVKPNNRYGEAQAGARIYVTRRELEAHPRCLELAPTASPEPGPRTAIVPVRADVAKLLGFPMGRRQEGPLVYEVTRLRPDGKEPLPTRQELEARAAGPVVARAEVRVMDAPEVQQFARDVKARIEQLKAEAEAEQERLKDELRRRHEKIEAQAAALDAARKELDAACAEVAKLRAELEAAKAPAQVAPKGKAKE